MCRFWQDGGVLTNNPTAIAIHECRLLWPQEALQCVVSLGTGRYEPTSMPQSPVYTSLKTKVEKFVQSATDTEGEGLCNNNNIIIFIYCRLFFFFRILPSGVATADFPSQFVSIICILLRHFNHCHVLCHLVYKPPFSPSPVSSFLLRFRNDSDRSGLCLICVRWAILHFPLHS